MSGTIKTSALSNAGVLDGTELVPIVMGGISKKATTQQIADLSGATDTSPFFTLNVLSYGATANDSSFDNAAAFGAAWAALKALRNSTRLMVPVKLVIPPGVYYVSTSINWTGGSSTFAAWNTHIEANGAYIFGKTTGEAVVDVSAVRGIHIYGLGIYGDPLNIPSCAVLYGPRLADACGNNFFVYMSTEGYFSGACFANIGSETTQHMGCYMINKNPSTTAYSYIGDGRNLFGFSSNYVTYRTPGTQASFSNNDYVDCRFAKHVGGDCIALDSAFGHRFRGGYNLSFSGSNFRFFTAADARISNIEIDMLCETAQSPGVDHFLTIQCPDGESTAIEGLRLRLGSPHASDTIIRVVADSNDNPMTTGGVSFRGADIYLGSAFSGTPMMFAGLIPYVQGSIVAPSENLNLAEPDYVYGMVTTDSETTLVSVPGLGSSCLVMDRTGSLNLYGNEKLHGNIVAVDTPRTLRRTVLLWEAGQVITFGDLRRNSSLRIYRCVSVGGTTADAAPEQLSGTYTGPDGITWLYVEYDPDGSASNIQLNNLGPVLTQRVLLANISTDADPNGHIYRGNGSPEGMVSAPVGSWYQRADGGAGTSFYVKETGSGNTGWVAK